MVRALRDRPVLLGAASLITAFGGAYALLQWALAVPAEVLVGRPGVHGTLYTLDNVAEPWPSAAHAGLGDRAPVPGEASRDLRPPRATDPDVRGPAPLVPAADCLDCHVPFRGTPPTRCLAPGCHGSLATGTPPRDGPAMPVRFHAALRGHDCGSCHAEHERPPPRDGRFSHRAIPEAIRVRCQACHSGEGIDHHARTDAVACDLCHGTENWTRADMVHTRVDDRACDLCHRAPDDPRHVSVEGNCENCHDAPRSGAHQPAEK